MADFSLGRGLGSLIPKKNEAPEDPEALDLLHSQKNLEEPTHYFFDQPRGAEPHIEAVSMPRFRIPLSQRQTTNRQEPGARRGESIFWIEVSKIEPNPYQPRRDFDLKELQALADSIREHGVLQPLLVSKIRQDTPRGLDVRYQLIAGERRWRAAKMAGLREVPVIVRDRPVSDEAKLELALIENVQREDLNPIERAKAFAELMDTFGLSQQEISQRIGKSRESVTNLVRLLRLPDEIQTAISAGLLSEGHARALLMLEHDPEQQLKLFKEIRESNLSVRDSEHIAGSLAASKRPHGRGRRLSGGALDPDSRKLQRELEEMFGTRVSIIKKGERGQIIVEFFSNEELHGIIERIAKGSTD